MRDALSAFDQGARVLERAYRELWGARESERRRHETEVAERLRDLGHEIKNPLGGVRGLAALLGRELEESGGSERAKRLARALQSGVLAVESVLEAHVRSPEGAAEADAIACEVAELARAESDAEGHEVELVVECREGIELPISPSRLREVLSNLVRNAREATAPRGTVCLRIESRPDDVMIEIEDDGAGLPDANVEDLFRRGVSTKGRGRGRGLAITRELVEEVGGTIVLERRARGARARAIFPRRPR
jgi:signal transduction histidine kinase